MFTTQKEFNEWLKRKVEEWKALAEQLEKERGQDRFSEQVRGWIKEVEDFHILS